MAYFLRINTVEEFDQYIGDPPNNNLAYVLARYFHNGRYLPGYIDISLQVGFFIYKNQAQQFQTISVAHCGFDVLCNSANNLEWRLHLLEHELDLIDAFPADPRARDEFLYFGRCHLDDIYFYGQVHSNGMCYFRSLDGVIHGKPEFEILVYKQSKLEGRKTNGAHARIRVIRAQKVTISN